jgi:hypothetical protein
LRILTMCLDHNGVIVVVISKCLCRKDVSAAGLQT